ncbi:class I SAM-dependent methyltransferase [Ruminiclostridium cellobioparum]|jgi:trans-aconitate methyltransferase|uniref:class I SAM-dependent methyltransferase n=1 Tax=Ruminiclostridium cellobioparum TaxID=29355 RepID=UPI000489A68D|nr:class I SAM-dependent methyltransferase [Ruminiclostridium cellobioparum]
MSHMEKIKKYYEENNIEGYPDYYILGWESEAAQELRFKQLVGNIDLNGKTILDVGCGTGNLLEYISRQFKDFNYTGIDVLPHMIQRAGEKKLNGRFVCMDLFKSNPYGNKTFDVIFSSGIFNLNLGNNQEFLMDAVDIFQSLAREAISFNLLWDKSTDKDVKYFYFSPEEVQDILSSKYSDIWQVSIVKGYLHNDFTVHLT